MGLWVRVLLSVYKMHQMNIHCFHKSTFFLKQLKCIRVFCFCFPSVELFQLWQCYYHLVCFGSDVCGGCFWTDVYHLIWQNSEKLSTELLAFVHLYVIASLRALP